LVDASVVPEQSTDAFAHDHRVGGPWTAPDRRVGLTDAELRAARKRLPDAYRDAERADAERWRNPPNGPCLYRDASGEFGRACRSNDAKPPVGDQRYVVTDEARRRVAQAYADYDAADRERWRHAK
jgi:hypothetical protein